MTDTRQDILNYLREKGEADVSELAETLGLSPVTIHYHINVLLRDGLLEGRAVRQGVGRPRNVFTHFVAELFACAAGDDHAARSKSPLISRTASALT